MITGDDITELEREAFEEKYARVCRVIKDEFGLDRFHFTPGPKFVETPDEDVLLSIRESIQRLMNGDLEVVDDDD